MSQRNNDSTTPAADTHFHASRAASLRKKGFIGLAAAVVIAAGGYGVWYAMVGSRYFTTDNA